MSRNMIRFVINFSLVKVCQNASQYDNCFNQYLKSQQTAIHSNLSSITSIVCKRIVQVATVDEYWCFLARYIFAFLASKLGYCCSDFRVWVCLGDLSMALACVQVFIVHAAYHTDTNNYSFKYKLFPLLND